MPSLPHSWSACSSFVWKGVDTILRFLKGEEKMSPPYNIQ
jgi:hypothetical protein